jgi:hypothetical protein
MLTDRQLTELCDKMDIPLEAVLFKDEMPHKFKYNRSYIINIEDSEDENGNPNEGTHYTCLQINRYPGGKIEPFYFDSYGMPPPESVKKAVMNTCGQKLPFNTKDIQSLLNNACGFYCCALLHWINTFEGRTHDLYQDVENFLAMFDDLNESCDFKKNEYILKLFFIPKNPKLRKEIEIKSHPQRIITEDISPNNDLMRVPVAVKLVDK